MIEDLTWDYQDYEQCSFRDLTPEQQQAILNHEKIYYQGPPVYGEWTPITEIVSGLFIGGMESINPETCQQYGIDVVLNMADDCNDDEIPGLEAMVKLGIADGELSPKGCWQRAAIIIDDAISHGFKVNVHCRAGISRSVTAAITYLMLYKGWGWADAYRRIRAKRPCVYPHPILMRGLIRDLGPNFIF